MDLVKEYRSISWENTLPHLVAAAFLILKVAIAIIIFIIGKAIINIIRKFIKELMKRANIDIGVQQFFDAFIKVTLLFLLAAGILVSFGVAASSIAALVGTFGLTIGLAMQGYLSNLAGGVLILLFKPFRVGDVITEDAHGNTGTVTETRLLYTKLVTLDQTTIVVPNGVLANTSLKNVTAKPIRRLDLSVCVAYNSDISLVKDTLCFICHNNQMVLESEGVEVFIKDLDSFSVIMGVRAYVNSEDYLTAKSDILESILIEFANKGIEIPYPRYDISSR